MMIGYLVVFYRDWHKILVLEGLVFFDIFLLQIIFVRIGLLIDILKE